MKKEMLDTGKCLLPESLIGSFMYCFINFQIELENTLEQEQENLVNRLWKRMDKLEAEKRYGMLEYILS